MFILLFIVRTFFVYVMFAKLHIFKTLGNIGEATLHEYVAFFTYQIIQLYKYTFRVKITFI